MASRVVVVGASLAGLSVVRALRQAGHRGDLVLIGAEAHHPYDRPPLSKQILLGDAVSDPSTAAIALAGDGELADLGVRTRLGVRACGLDLAGGRVLLEDGTAEAFDQVVLATGAAPRRPSSLPPLAGIVALRTWDDAVALHAALRRARRPVMLGGGFIGLEVATAAATLGRTPIVVEGAPTPLHRFGEQVGRAVAAIHRHQGIDMRTGRKVVAVEGDGRVERIILDDATVIDTDLLVVGAGAAPATSWLRGSGLDISDGVVCDDACRSVSDPRVFAAGDVCRWHNPLFGRSMRVEHRQAALRHADVIAAAIRGDGAASAAFVPYFWSDQAGTKIQFHGHLQPGDTVHAVHRDGARLAALYSRDGVLTGALTIGAAGWSARLARQVAGRADPATALRLLTGPPHQRATENSHHPLEST
ncbi:FAD/NAD(P)-binding oxidoreductase [Actinomadura napierensis]|uniref:FAD/NAD(P)-binding oxidoreductase n=1 Tax=Actinomadura napierensis TaxID=267854 RepID=A0ABN2XVN6_9ACTN